MEEEVIKRLRADQLHCAKCHLIIPFTFKKKSEEAYTIPSFTMVGSEPVCYRDYHRKELRLSQSTTKK